MDDTRRYTPQPVSWNLLLEKATIDKILLIRLTRNINVVIAAANFTVIDCLDNNVWRLNS
jgi:hypothetical protein